MIVEMVSKEIWLCWTKLICSDSSLSACIPTVMIPVKTNILVWLSTLNSRFECCISFNLLYITLLGGFFLFLNLFFAFYKLGFSTLVDLVVFFLVESRVVYLPMSLLLLSLSGPLSQKHVRHETICCLQTWRPLLLPLTSLSTPMFWKPIKWYLCQQYRFGNILR